MASAVTTATAVARKSKTTGNALSLTFGDQAENHRGMQVLGDAASTGYTLKDLQTAATRWEALGATTEIIALHEGIEGAAPAYVLVARQGAQAVLKAHGATAEELQAEQEALPVDTKAYMYGRVVNKKARHNLCYAAEAQEPEYEKKKGRIVAFKSVPLLDTVRKSIQELLQPEETTPLVCELNLYYDPSVCGIGWHGDTERKKVVCVRLGVSIPLQYRWFHHHATVGDAIPIALHHGDCYVMSDKAVGYDWKSSSILTLRHAAGAAKFFKVPKAARKKRVAATAAAVAARGGAACGGAGGAAGAHEGM